MKKTKKKVLFVLIMAVISVMSLTAFPATAGTGMTLTDIDYMYEGMSSEQAAQIVRAMFGIQGEPVIQPFNLACIFGHSIRTGTITATQHRVFADNPRCSRTTSHVEYCTRANCSHFVIVRQSTARIICC